MAPQDQPVERRLAAIFAADVEGYSRRMSADEVGTFGSLTAHREIMDRLIAAHRGRIANTAGDSVLAEFPSAVDAVKCAVEVQEGIARANESAPEEARLQFRIGIHVGDVMVRGGDLFGDGVNIAARLQTLAEPGGVFVSEDAHHYARKALPFTFDDRGQLDAKNIEEGVRAFAVRLPGDTFLTTRLPSPKPLSLPNRPSLAVLPFTNISGDPEQEYFADGIVEDLISALSRVRSFFVIARNSSFTYKGRNVDVRTVSRDLGVRYVLEGSVRKAGGRVRISAQLVDGNDGTHVWADRYDGELTDIFDLQDQLTSTIVGAIEPSIRASEIERARRKRPDSLDAYDLVMRAMPTVWSNDSNSASEGLQLLEQAIALDPKYPLAAALASCCHAQQVVYVRSADPDRDRTRALDLAQYALRLDSDDPLVLTALATGYTLVRRLDLARPPLEKALLIDPNSAWAWQRSGWLHVYIGDPNRAIEHFHRGLRLSPVDPLRFNSYAGIGAANADAGRFDEAIEWLEKALRERPDATWVNRLVATACGNAGRLEEAREAVNRLRKAYPEMTISQLADLIPANPAYMARYTEGLRKAGLPE
jgi:adenylate cyclase